MYDHLSFCFSIKFDGCRLEKCVLWLGCSLSVKFDVQNAPSWFFVFEGVALLILSCISLALQNGGGPGPGQAHLLVTGKETRCY